ncbi:peptidoglycan-binding domain-containing protein [Streptomyces coeruleorubidus]|uniref:peptidoglycan-binding domain-containing protein n=1 Tax=Streptomyces coeruleorubidus TaxID=116188 RepID=UPI00237FAD20|nr:peptidoglycan-binding domain-containing protein [Streptomyces coeruleorubidus]WDV56410.1 peptidoglycan-binding domain-containing protein [Streptomyces coeruleorubidus]
MSTPSEPRQPHDGPALEPIRVLRPRRTDALAELMREYREEIGSAPAGNEPGGYGPRGYESVALPWPTGSEDLTQELPPLTRENGDGRAGPGSALRRTAVAVAVVAAAALGFGGAALVLPGGNTADKAVPAPRPTTSAAAPAPTPPAADPDGPGTLREGATGPEVTELQERLLRIPDVYRDGSTSGRYDPTLTAAVARFQLWYGIRGDETGVYGNDTRLALESRTTPGTD